MKKPVLVVALTAAVALGILLGALLFRPARVEEAPRPDKVHRTASAPKDGVGEELSRANERIGALETGLRELQEKVENRGKDKEALLQKLKEELANSPDLAGEGIDEKDALPFGWRVPNRPQGVSSVLGLDVPRRKTLEETYQSFVERIRSLEKVHARTTVDGDTTRIEIAPFPAEGKALIDEWSARITALLTPEEKDKYKKLSLGLLPADVGQAERVIAIVNEADGTATATEYSADGKLGSGYYRGPKVLALAPYTHLLKK